MPLIAKDLETLCDDDFQAKMLNHPLRKAHYEQLGNVLIHLLKKHTYSSGKHIGQLTPAGNAINAILSGFQCPAKVDSEFDKDLKESRLDQLKQEVMQGILLHMPSVELELADTDFNKYEYVGYQERDGRHFILAVRLTDIVITYETVLVFLKAKVKSQKASEARRQQERVQQDKESAELMQELGLEDETSEIDEVSKQEVEEPIHHLADKNSIKANTPEPVSESSFLISDENSGRLFNFLSVHFEENQLQELREVLKGKSIGAQLLFKKEGNKLTDIFYRARKADWIKGKKYLLDQWICDNFLYDESGVAQPFKLQSVRKDTTGEDSKSRCKRPIPEAKSLFNKNA